MPAPSATAFFSTAAYEDALLDRRLHEMSAFNGMADFAMRGHALALKMVRTEYPKRTNEEFKRGREYFEAVMAADVYAVLGAFAKARATDRDYASALREALRTPKVLMMSRCEGNEEDFEDSVRNCHDHLQDRRNESNKVSVTNDTLVEALYVLQFLETHLERHDIICDGNILGIDKIKDDINDALNAGTGMENAAREANDTPEIGFFDTVHRWLGHQIQQSHMLEAGLIQSLQRNGQNEEAIAMLKRGTLYSDICSHMQALLGNTVQSGMYMSYYAIAADRVVPGQSLDPVVALHRCMQSGLEAQIKVIQSGRSALCGAEQAPVFAEAYQLFMNAVSRQFPMTKAAPVPVPAIA